MLNRHAGVAVRLPLLVSLATLLVAPSAVFGQVCIGLGMPGELLLSGRVWSIGGEHPVGVSAGVALDRGLSFEAEYFWSDDVERFSGAASWSLARQNGIAICPGLVARRWEGNVAGGDRDLTALDFQVGFGYPLGAGEGRQLVLFGVPALTLGTDLGPAPVVGDPERRFHGGVATTAGTSLLFSRVTIRGTAFLASYMDTLFGIGAGVRIPY